jgi:hypothetical protein
MFDMILQKHVSLSLANGNQLDGFVTEMDDDFIKVIERSNDILIVRTGDVSCVRIFGARQMFPAAQDVSQQIENQEEQEENKIAYIPNGRGSQFAMAHPSMSTMPTAAPKFERKT